MEPPSTTLDAAREAARAHLLHAADAVTEDVWRALTDSPWTGGGLGDFVVVACEACEACDCDKETEPKLLDGPFARDVLAVLCGAPLLAPDDLPPPATIGPCRDFAAAVVRLWTMWCREKVRLETLVEEGCGFVCSDCGLPSTGGPCATCSQEAPEMLVDCMARAHAAWAQVFQEECNPLAAVCTSACLRYLVTGALGPIFRSMMIRGDHVAASEAAAKITRAYVRALRTAPDADSQVRACVMFRQQWFHATHGCVPCPDGQALVHVVRIVSEGSPKGHEEAVAVLEWPLAHVATLEHEKAAVEFECRVHVTILGILPGRHCCEVQVRGMATAGGGDIAAALSRLHTLLLVLTVGMEFRGPDPAAKPCPATSLELSVFVNNSYIHLGAQDGESLASGKGHSLVHLKVAEVIERVVRGRPVARKFVGGVMPDSAVLQWRRLGFKVRTGAVSDAGANIDGLLQAQILDSVTSAASPGILVLLSGDGMMNGDQASYPRCLMTALRLHWKVEVYGWRRTLAPCYAALAHVSAGQLTVSHLDDWRNEVTLSLTDTEARGPLLSKRRSQRELDPSATLGPQRELTFPEVLKLVEAVVSHSMASPGAGVLASTFKAAYRSLHNRDLQLVFGGQRVQLKDVMERSRIVERVTWEGQPLYRIRAWAGEREREREPGGPARK